MANFFVKGNEWSYETDKKYSSLTGRAVPNGYHLPSLQDVKNLLECIDKQNIPQEVLRRGAAIWVQEIGEIPFQIILNNELTRQEKRNYTNVMPIYIKNDENWLANHQDMVGQRFETLMQQRAGTSKYPEKRKLLEDKNEGTKSNEILTPEECCKEANRVLQMVENGHSLNLGGCSEFFVSNNEGKHLEDEEFAKFPQKDD